jgi:hypothetical protein
MLLLSAKINLYAQCHFTRNFQIYEHSFILHEIVKTSHIYINMDSFEMFLKTFFRL